MVIEEGDDSKYNESHEEEKHPDENFMSVEEDYFDNEDDSTYEGPSLSKKEIMDEIMKLPQQEQKELLKELDLHIKV